jgi:hypothetical protein
VDAWLDEHGGELGALAQEWFEVMRRCGDEVRYRPGCETSHGLMVVKRLEVENAYKTLQIQRRN